jgi:hypothetical protein
MERPGERGYTVTMKRLAYALLVAVALTSAVALADQSPTKTTAALSPSEKAFVAGIQSDLMARFPTAADAERAGYFRYTNEDETGAISYANLQWNSADPKHPSQLWYDKSGALLGADFSVLTSVSPKRPSLWGVDPGRWYLFDGHVHWVGRDAQTGKLTYDHYAMDPKFVKAGGNLNDPSAATLVAMKKVPSANDVVKIFHFPSVWDLIVWVKPNPNGAFAEKNPNVKP